MAVRASRVRFAIAAAVAAAIGATGTAVWATTVTPTGDPFIATLAAGVNLTVSTPTVTSSCSVATFNGNVPNAPGNAVLGGVVTEPIAGPGFAGGAPCTFTVLGVSGNATWTAAAGWDFTFGPVAAGNPPPVINASLVIPKAGLVVKVTVFGLGCTYTAAPNGPVMVTGTWVNGGAAPSLFTVANANVPVQSAGGGLCPTVNNVMLNGAWDVFDPLNGNSAITISPPP